MAKTVIGTPYYMSPELFRNQPYSVTTSSASQQAYWITAIRIEIPSLFFSIALPSPDLLEFPRCPSYLQLLD